MRAAMTLIELVTVIAIVGVLSVLLVLIIRSAMAQVQYAKSSSNLRQMGVALLAYSIDRDGKLIEGAFNPTYQGDTVRTWFNALDGYMGGTDYTKEGRQRGVRPDWQNCPAKVFPEPVYDATGSGVGVGYGWNHGNFGYTPSWYPDRTGWDSHLLEVEKPSETIIIGTSIDDVEGSDVLRHVLIYANDAWASRRFKGKGLYLHLDGHVAAYSPEKIMADNAYLFKKSKE